jgi:hypothetical protein
VLVAHGFHLRYAQRTNALVIPELVPGIQLSADAAACGTMDPADKRRDDSYANQRLRRL